jgi:hypothetical protein
MVSIYVYSSKLAWTIPRCLAIGLPTRVPFCIFGVYCKGDLIQTIKKEEFVEKVCVYDNYFVIAIDSGVVDF